MKLFKKISGFFKNIFTKGIWWPLVLTVVLLIGANAWLYPTIGQIEKSAFDVQSDSLLLAKQSLENLFLIHTTLQIRGTASAMEITPEMKDSFLMRLMGTAPYIKELKVIDDQGTITNYYQNKDGAVLRLDPPFAESYAETELLKDVAGRRLVEYRGPVFFEDSNLMMEFAFPLFLDKKFSGALVMKANINFVRKFYSVTRVGNGYIVDSGGKLLAHSAYPDKTPEFSVKDREIVQKVLAGGKENITARYLNEKGETVQAVASYSGFLKWGVVVEEPAAKMFAARNRIIILAAILFAIEFFLLMLLIRKTLSLARTASELKTSKDAVEESRSVLEVKVLARTRELQEMAKHLEATVQERTKNLEHKIEELEKFHRLTGGRETKMVELKEEIKKIKNETENKSN